MEKVVKTQNKGKRKIPIEPIKNKAKKQVTFSKRRGGLIKKGSELCCLCGANLAIITFSGAGKLFCFGHPSVEAVIQRYINSSNNNTSVNSDHFNDNCNINNNVGDINMLSHQHKQIFGQIEAEKRASSSSNINNGGFWWNDDINKLGLVELEHFKVALEGLRNEVATRVNEINSSSMSFVPQNFDFGTRGGNIVAHRQGFDGSNNFLID